MKLKNLISSMALQGEDAMDAVRRLYIANIEKLAAEGTSLPGQPSKLLAALGETLLVDQIRQKFDIRVWIGKDDELEGEFASNRPRSRWWHRDQGTPVEMEIVWKAHAPPEAIARARVIGEDEYQHHLKTIPWTSVDVPAGGHDLARAATIDVAETGDSAGGKKKRGKRKKKGK